MLKYFENSEATFPIGPPSSKRLFQVSSGSYAGRVIALLHDYHSPTAFDSLKMTYADYPYTEWSTVSTLLNDNLDSPIDAVMDSDGNLYIAYTESSTNQLIFRKLTFSAGGWTAGSAIVIFNGSLSINPSILIDADDRLHISWSRYSGGVYYLNYKYSDDDGATWGTGPADVGDTLSSGATELFPKLLLNGSDLFIIYEHGGNKISFRKKELTASVWDTEADIVSASGLDYQFDIAISDDNRIALVYDDGSLKFREYDSASWGGTITIDSNEATFPQVSFVRNNPNVIYLSVFGTNQMQMYHCKKDGASFTTPAILDSGIAVFDSVILYDYATGAYQDLTSEAADATAADIFYAGSSVMVKTAGDAIYLGSDDKFNQIKLSLSTLGIGGNVLWQYHDGSGWISFTPAGGAFHLTQTEKTVILWNDQLSIPESWQKSSVNSTSRYWIRAIVSSTFSTGPVGSQMSSIPEISGLILMEQ